MSKQMIQTRYATLRAPQTVDSENRTYEFLISNETPDSYGTVFRKDGWELDAYRANPIVSFNHNTWSSDPDAAVIGRSEIRFEGNDMIATLTLEPGNPVADTVKRKIDNGYLNSASIGAHIIEATRGDFEKGENPDLIYFNRQQLLEWSVVPVGSNPDAVKRNKEALQETAIILPQDPAPAQRNTALLDEFDAAYKFNLNNTKK